MPFFYALVDVAGHKQHEQSRIIDYEPERLRLAAPKLLAACRMVVDRWEKGDLAEAARACAAAIAEAEAAGNAPVSGEAASKPYSVLLLYPDWANDGGAETYYAIVEAPDSIAAVAEAQRQALATNEWPDVDPADFAPLLVTEGRNFAQPLFKTHVRSMALPEGENGMTEGKEQELCLSRCPLCGGEIQATVDRYHSLRGGVWVESGVDGDTRFYCENDCDLSEYSERIPGIG